MIGGGVDAFIGAVHRHAAALDGLFVLRAGALSSTPERARASAAALGLAPGRGYATWQELLAGESRLPAEERAEVVSIVTPNDTHFEIARSCAQAGLHVVLDKPMVHSSAQAAALRGAVEKAGVVLAVTYNYTGYPMVREARRLVRSGAIGPVRKVFVEYHQGWLATRLEAQGQKQAAWRNDPARAGLGGAVGDIGTHAENLLAFVTGLRIESLCAELASLVPGRALDDDAAVLLRLSGGARGVLTVCQVAIGERNALTLRVHGERGSIAWAQEQPEQLVHHSLEGETRVLHRGGALGPEAARASRLPGGHPEGFIEAFANIYRGVFEAVWARRGAGTASSHAELLPGLADGARGVRFVEQVVASARQNGAWVAFSDEG